MNGTTSTETYPAVIHTTTAARARAAISQNLPGRSRNQPRPAIDTSVPSGYFSARQQPTAVTSPSSSHPNPSKHRLASTSSATSSSSSHTNASLLSISGHVMTTTSSTGSLASGSFGDPLPGIQEDAQDTMKASGKSSVFKTDESLAAMNQGPLSPSESLGSVGDHLHSYVLALHDFTPIAPNATCLSFRAGQIIQVLNRDASGWWDGELEGRRGWFPSNYVSGLDQVTKLRDEVLVELQSHRRQGSTPSLASWTSGLSYSSSALQHGATMTQTSMRRNVDPQIVDLSLDETARQPLDMLQPSSKGYDHPQHDGAERAGALSPTFSIYQAIAEGNMSSRAFSPTPSFTALYQGQYPPLLTPLLHALSLLHRAVAARHQSHYQPSTACVISCVRSLLTSTECLHRDAPILRRVPQLAQERKIILGNLGTLVSQARRCSDWPSLDSDEMWDETAVREAEVEQRDWELEQMLRMGGEVFRNVTQFLETCEQNEIELPVSRRSYAHSQSGSSGSEREMERQMRIDLGMIGPTPPLTPHKRTHSGSNSIMRTGSLAGIPRNHTDGDASPQFPSPDKLSNMVRPRTKSLNDLREQRRIQQAERARQRGPDAMPVPAMPPVDERKPDARPQLRSLARSPTHRPQLSISTSSSLSSGSYDSYGSPVSQQFPSGPSTTAQVLSALRTTHDDLLSIIAAFIGHVHSHGRDSHASSKGHLIELARETVDIVRQLLTLVEAVARHPDVGSSKVMALQTAKDSLFASTNTLVEAVRELTGPVATASEEEERSKTLNGATGVLRIAADCVAAVKICLSRPIGEEPFIICLPSLTVADPAASSLAGSARQPGKRQRPVSYLRRRTSSLMSQQDLGLHTMTHATIGIVAEDGEQRLDEEETVQPAVVRKLGGAKTAIAAGMPSGLSGESESVHTEDSDEDGPPSSSLSEPSNDEGMREPLIRKDSRSTFETKILHGELPMLPPISTVPPTPSSPTPSPMPLDVDSVFAKTLTHEYDVRDIAYNQEGAIVGATLEVMVEKLTPHDVLVDPAFQQIFMMTWRLFVSPPELVQALIRRYNLPEPLVAKEEDREIWIKRKSMPVKLRVFNLIKTWLENYWRPATDDVALTQLSQFVRDVITLQFPAPAQRIMEVIRARTLSDESIVISRPIDRTKSIDRLRDGTSLPPTPVSPSEIPRPSINRTLFTALKNKNFANVAVMDFDSLELARQFTIMESKLYLRVQPEEILELGQPGAAPAVNVKAISTLSTAVTGWVTESILNESDSKKRTNLLKFFIKVADRCSGLNNYSTSRSILAALDSSTISRLHQTWATLPQKSKVQLEALRKLADHARNYSEYRSRLRNTTPPAVPFLGLYLTDVTFCREGNPSHRASPRDPDRKLINFNKYHKLARIVQDMQRFQVAYNLKEIPEVQQYLTAQFENAKNAGDLQDLYRRSLLVEPRRAADTPTNDTKPVLQLFGLGTIGRNHNLSQLPKTVISS